MFAVIFLVQPKRERWDDYLNLAKFLKPKLEAIDGFIDNERYESTREKGRLLSLSTWRDEKALVRWRTQAEHHGVQERGRFEIFEDYSLRVGEITADSDPPEGLAIVATRLDETAVGAASLATIVEVTPAKGTRIPEPPVRLPELLGVDPGAEGCVDAEIFESIYTPGKLLLLGLWKDAGAGAAWKPRLPAGADKMRSRQVRIIRDYGMRDRREAPQFYPEVPAPRRL